MKPLTIVFAGTPEFGLPCLDALTASDHHLCAIYTQPDRPAGRGRQLQASAVKVWAQAHHLPVYQPINFKDSETVETLVALKPDVLVVIAYGLILPRTVLNIPRLGCINVHASLLPKWRGASPIQHAILHGDLVSGVSIMKMDVGMDTGAVFAEIKCPIAVTDTAGDLHDTLAQLAPKGLLDVLSQIATGEAHASPQDSAFATYAPKINKTDACIQWHQSAIHIDQHIRAFNPWPIAYTPVNDMMMRIYQAQVIEQSSKQPPGTVISIDKQGILVATGEQCILIEVLQFPGAKAMSVALWLNASSRPLHVGHRFL